MKLTVWDKLAQSYDTLWVQKHSLTPSRNHVLARINGAGEGFSLLDVGCATGQLLCALKERHPQAQLVGIDQSPHMIAAAKCKRADIEFHCLSVEAFRTELRFDFITCCHAFPYVSDQSRVLHGLSLLLKNTGKAIFIQAGINNFYDRIVMAVVEKTAEAADYLSAKDFCRLASEHFVVEECFSVRERWYMPSLCGFVLGKKA